MIFEGFDYVFLIFKGSMYVHSSWTETNNQNFGNYTVPNYCFKGPYLSPFCIYSFVTSTNLELVP